MLVRFRYILRSVAKGLPGQMSFIFLVILEKSVMIPFRFSIPTFDFFDVRVSKFPLFYNTDKFRSFNAKN